MEADAAKGRAGEKSNQKKTEAGKKVPFLRMFQYADGTDVLLMLVGVAAALASGLSLPLWTVMFSQFVHAFGGATEDTVLRRVNKEVLKLVYLVIGAAIVSFLQGLCWTITGERQARRIRSLYLKSILRQDISFFDVEMTTGQVVSGMSGDTVLIQGAIGEKVGTFLQLAATFVGAFAVAMIKGWLLSVIMLSTLPLVALPVGAASHIFSKISSKEQVSNGDIGDLVEQTVGSIRTVVSFNGEKQAIALYNKLIKKAYSAAVKESLTKGFVIGAFFCVYLSSYGLAFWYGGKLILSKGYTGAQVINVLTSIIIGAISIGNAGQCITAFSQGQTAAYRLFMTIKRKPEIDCDDKTGRVLQDIRGDVELKDVYFSYPARPEQQVFDEFSLKVPSGTTMAIVGESGSGKSTVISLVDRFYDPQAGEVLIDGINLKSLQLDWIRGEIGLVSQEPLLFMTSIKDNITYGKEGATIEEIKRAAEFANAAKFIDKLPNGYDTVVGQRGAQLSGGQKQRIAIARAMLKNPKILLLDEATSALDVESERVVQEALNRIMVDKTTIVVAHRLTTVRDAQCISVLHRGKLVEQGTHSELVVNPDGAYSQLIRLQNRADEQKLDSGSKSRRLSLNRSISRGSGRNTSVELFEWSASDDANSEEKGDDDAKVPERLPWSIGRLASLNKPATPVLLLGSLAAGIHGALLPIFGLVVSNAIKTFYEPPHKLRKGSSHWSLMCVALAIISIISIPAEYYLFGVAGGKLVERIRALTFESVLLQEVAWFDDPANSSGALSARLSVDALNVRRLVGDNLTLIVQTASTILAGFSIAIIADWKLSLIAMCAYPLVGLIGYAQMKFLNGFTQDAKMMHEDACQVATDAVSSIRTISSFCAQKRVMRTYNRKCESLMKHGVRTGLIGGLGFGFSLLVIYLTYGLFFYAGAQFVSHGKSTFAGLYQVFLALAFASIGISQTSALASDSSKAMNSATSILALLDRKSRINSGIDEGLTFDEVSGTIEIRHVSFKYPTRPDVQIFSDFSLHIPAGKTVALVGQSGNGKSTVIALLERFYDPDSGSILLDGVDIKSLNLNWLRDQIGLVGQEPVLFNTTIRANIAYGRHGDAAVAEEELVAAAKAANAHDFISGLPSGYDTAVGERGVQLSGGQKQRVAIARAVLKKPRILLLDEATSALDAESERVVQATLDRVMVGKTSVVVAHRLSTIRCADVIAVVKDGVVVERGRHDALMAVKDGVYTSLVDLHSASSA